MAAAQLSTQQLQTDIQNELTTTNQLLRLISLELQKIKSFTMSGGELEANVKQNASIITELAKLQHINVKDLPPLNRFQSQLSDTQDSIQNKSNLDDSQ